MIRHAVRIVRALAIMPFAAAICSAAVPLRYELGFERWNTHLMDVTIRASGLAGKTVRFAMPVWSPGSYVVRNFATEVQDFGATDSGGRRRRRRLPGLPGGHGGEPRERDRAGRLSRPRRAPAAAYT